MQDVASASGTSLVDHVLFIAFGQTEESSGTPSVFGFQGMMQNLIAPSGIFALDYDNARWYDPATQNFISQDPKGLKSGDPNFYRFTDNDPVNNTDPTGMMFQSGLSAVSSVIDAIAPGVGSAVNDLGSAVEQMMGFGSFSQPATNASLPLIPVDSSISSAPSQASLAAAGVPQTIGQLAAALQGPSLDQSVDQAVATPPPSVAASEFPEAQNAPHLNISPQYQASYSPGATSYGGPGISTNMAYWSAFDGAADPNLTDEGLSNLDHWTEATAQWMRTASIVSFTMAAGLAGGPSTAMGPNLLSGGLSAGVFNLGQQFSGMYNLQLQPTGQQFSGTSLVRAMFLGSATAGALNAAGAGISGMSNIPGLPAVQLVGGGTISGASALQMAGASLQNVSGPVGGVLGSWINSWFSNGSGNSNGPVPNGGYTSYLHGGTAHDSAINDYVDNLPSEAENVRKNQVQVDVNGNVVGDNRPDIQYDLNGQHYVVEVDNVPSVSSAHAQEIRENDPDAHITQIVLGH